MHSHNARPFATIKDWTKHTSISGIKKPPSYIPLQLVIKEKLCSGTTGFPGDHLSKVFLQVHSVSVVSAVHSLLGALLTLPDDTDSHFQASLKLINPTSCFETVMGYNTSVCRQF